MKTLTTDKLAKALKKALKTINLDLSEGDMKNLLGSIKIGHAAKEHLGMDGVLGYFCTESTLLSCAYYDAPSIWHSFIEAVDEALGEGMYVDAYNSVEFTVCK